jgi:hypothetical protein
MEVKHRQFKKTVAILLTVCFVLSITASAVVAAGEKPILGVVPPNSNFHGKTYAEWNAKWWKWVFSIPKSCNPLFDDGTGKFTTAAQSGDVWFLAGSWKETPPDAINLNVPEGKAIFFPIINAESSKIEGFGNNKAELRSDVEKTIGYVKDKKAIVDGKVIKNLDNYKAESDLFVFWLPPDNVQGHPTNVLGISVGQKRSSSIAVADGYWIMLNPLSVGKHTITIYGRAVFLDGSEFVTKMTYNLNVIPKNHKRP